MVENFETWEVVLSDVLKSHGGKVWFDSFHVRITTMTAGGHILSSTRTQVHSARSSLTVTHSSANGGKDCEGGLTSLIPHVICRIFCPTARPIYDELYRRFVVFV